MDSFKRIRSLLLKRPDLDEERLSRIAKTTEQLEELQVPVSDDPCRTCANPCDLAHHPEFPARFDVDTTSEMLGSVKPYYRQVVISTGKADWEREITDEAGSLARYLSETGERFKRKDKNKDKNKDKDQPVFSAHGETRLAILNAAHHTVSHEENKETVLVFPDYKLVRDVPRSEEGAEALWAAVLDPSVGRAGGGSGTGLRSWPLPYACVILLCSHKKRDNRCHIAAPKLQTALTHALESEGYEVHTQLDEPDGPSSEDITGTDEERSAEFVQRLRRGTKKVVLVLRNSHVGGHRYAGNMLIYTPQGDGSGVWYGRVTPHEVPAVVKATVCEGRVIPELLRGGVNLARPQGQVLLSW